jgi:betaine-aldehyde dehydrogenase
MIDGLSNRPQRGAATRCADAHEDPRMTATEQLATLRMVIGGDSVDASDGQSFEITNPANGKVIGTAPQGGKADVDKAVAAAQAALDAPKGWSTWAAGKRGRTLAKLAALVKDHTEELAQLESRNTGKPITSARGEITGVSLVLDYYAGAANKIFGQTIPVSKPGLDMTLREPIGVVGLIVPWNFPLYMASWKLGPALAAGNTCILKPASYSPMTALRLGELALEAGFPPGVINVVTGPGGSAGAAIAAHPGIGKVAFTGETTTGQEIMRLAAGNVKKISLELGGKSANVVYADADLERFGAESPYSVFDNCGQDCCARSRILVERSVQEKVFELFAEGTKKVKVGDPADDATEVGTLVSFKQRDRVRDYIEIGREEGANLVLGGMAPDDPALADGAYLMPTIFDGVSNDMRIAREEIFGPVVSIIPFDDEAEAIRLANETPYGLSGSVWSRDIGKALRTAKGIQSGVLSVNSNSSVHVEAPFGGYKMSGIGRELGMAALEMYTETKNIFIDLR